MALIDFDSFDSYGDNTQLRREYAVGSGGGLSANQGRFPGLTPNNAIYVGSSSGGGNYFNKSIPTKRTLYVGQAIKLEYYNATHFRHLQFCTTDGSAQLSLWWNPPDQLWRLYRGGGNGALTEGSFLAVSSAPFNHSVWHYVECGMYIDNTAGWFEMRVDGNVNPILSYTGDTQAHASFNSINLIQWEAHYFNTRFYVDDMYICDDSGAEDNTFIGDCKMIYGRPTVDGSVLQMVPNAGTTHYTQVDETTSDDDATYVQGNNVGDTDLYKTPNLLTEIPDRIHAVKVKSTVRKTDAGTGAVGHKLKIGTDETPVGTGGSLSTSYGVVKDIFSNQPNGEEWTKAALDTLEYGPVVKAT
jgi:hypothetical protein